MRRTRIPAEITSVEDRIVGDLSLPQLVLLTFPAVVVAGIYLAVPPVAGITTLKIVLVAVLSLLSSLLAVRREGRLLGTFVFEWLTYSTRSHVFVSDKNTSALRLSSTRLSFTSPRTPARKASKRKPPEPRGATIHDAMTDAVNLTYTKKVKIYVQIQQKS